MLVSGCYFSISFLTAAMNIDSAFALCIKLTYCFVCKSFHAVTRQFCHILFMLVSGCYFSISFLTAAMNIDSAFALCI